MPNTLEELEIIIRGNTSDAIAKLEDLKEKIKGKVTAEFEKMQPAINHTANEVGNFSKSTSRSIGATSLKVIAITLAFRKMLKVATKGFEYMAQYSNKFNATMSNMKSSFLQAGNSISTAFAPVLQALEPIIIGVANAITNLFTAIAKINTLLFTNNKTFTVAKKATTDYAKSVGNVAKANKGMLASFDELNVISEQSSGASNGMPNPADMFEEVAIDENLLNLKQKILDAFDLSELVPKIKSQLQGIASAFEPAIELVKKIGKDMWNGLYGAWQKWGSPIWENLKQAVINVGKIVSSVFENFLKPIWDNLVEMLGWLWDNHLQPLWNNLLDFFGELINGILEIWNVTLAPFIKWIVDTFGPVFANVINVVVNMFGSLTGVIADVVNGIIRSLKGIIQFIVGVFTGDWEKAWEGIKNFFGGIWDGIVGIVKGAINLVIDLINGMIAGLETALNWLVDKINSLEITNPFTGDEIWSPNVPRFDFGRIPKLEKGSILTEETLFVGGEYPSAKSNPEIVAPQSLMYETNVKANVPVINAIEEMSDMLVGALNNMSVYADFGYDKLRVGINKENRRVGEKLYGGAYV